MTMQIKDYIRYKLRKYVFIGAENINEFFDPEKFGLQPEDICTNCWKGFRCDFSIRNKNIYLETLEVNDSNNKYPDINGVKVKKHKNFDGYHVYEKLKLKLNYTGEIAIGKGLKEEYYDRAFIGEDAYENVIILTFKNGKLIEQKVLMDD